MNNDLEQFSEERLKEIVSAIKLEPCDYHAVYDRILHMEIAALARIALAAKQAKPVAQVYQPANIGICAALGPAIRMINVGLPAGTLLYTTPQPAHTEQDGWIKCSERMPDEEGMYQCWGKFFANDEYGYFCSSYRPHIKPMWVPVEDDCDPINVSVTHWMPLPAAPKPESEL